MSTSRNIQKVAGIIWHTSRLDEGTISATGANTVAQALLPALAEAWAEGYQAGYDDYDQGSETVNPYRPVPAD